MRNLLLLIAFAFLFAGCSQKVLIETTKPAKLDRAASKKKIAVMDFNKDTVHLGGKIESALNSTMVNNEQFFTIVNRNAIDTILKEQKFQYSGLASTKDNVKIGELLGAQALIIGKVNTGENESYVREQRTRCSYTDSKGKCMGYTTYYVTCNLYKYSLGANLSMVDVERGDLIYSNNYIKSKDYKECPQENDIVSLGLSLLQDKRPEKNVIYDRMADEVVKEFLPNIAPTTHKFYVVVLDSPEISYTKEQTAKLEAALEYLKHSRTDRAEEILSDLLTSTNDKCFVAAYDLGVIKEAKGELENAKQLYNLADRLTLKPNKTINEAIVRINEAINDQNRLNNQASKTKGKKK